MGLIAYCRGLGLGENSSEGYTSISELLASCDKTVDGLSRASGDESTRRAGSASSLSSHDFNANKGSGFKSFVGRREVVAGPGELDVLE